MSRRNVFWLAVIIGFGAVGWVLAGWLVGLVTAAAVLLVSEVVERTIRRRRRRAASATPGPSVGDIVRSRRRRC